MNLTTVREQDAYRQGWNRGAAYVAGAVMVVAGACLGFYEVFGVLL